ncbi:glutamyl-tRNA synthetase [Brucella melitensis]|nr:glutamyl-tRNA synthetase [Brucella melitensis]
MDAYRAIGYLPAALRNYLVRLGWSHGDDEIMSTEQMIEWFDVKDINKGAARFDFQKLEAINGLYMRSSDDQALFDALVAVLPEIEGGKELAEALDDKGRAQLLLAMPGLKERAKTLVELADGAKFIFASRPLALDEKAASLLNDEGRAVLKPVYPVLEAMGEWTAESLDAAIRAHAEAEGLKLGKIAQPLRAALTGRATSPGVFDVLVVLGREESLARIGDQIG